MNKLPKNVSVIVCHEADAFRPVSVNPASTGELFLVDKKDNSFEIMSTDALGSPMAIPDKAASLCVLSSDPKTILAEEPTGMTFRLKRAEGGEMGAAGKHTAISVMITWEKADRPPSAFDLDAYATDEDVVAVALAEPQGVAFVDADIRGSSPAAPPQSTIRKRVDDFKGKRKAEIEGKIAKAKLAKEAPKPGHTVPPPAHAHPASV